MRGYRGKEKGCGGWGRGAVEGVYVWGGREECGGAGEEGAWRMREGSAVEGVCVWDEDELASG